MSAMPAVLLVALLLTACSPTIQEQRSARVQAIQLELDSVLEAWRTEVNQRRFATSADAAQALASRYDMVYARWGLSPDLLTQATMAYAVAVAARVDRRELSADEANALLGRLRVDADRARATLGGKYSDNPASRHAAMVSWWTEYWTANQRAYQISSRNPVRCETLPQRADRPVVCR